MKSSEIALGRAACPCAATLRRAVEQRDQTTLDSLAPHIEQCSHCQSELAALMAQSQGLATRLVKNFLVGLAAFGAIGILMGIKGYTNALNHVIKQSGGSGSPWDKGK